MATKKTADEIYDVITNQDKLKEYRDLSSMKGASETKFHLELPYDEIKQFIASKREAIFSKIPEELHPSLRWEHIGSTSIKGMPGTMHPDAMILLKEFPPPKEVVSSLMDNDFVFFGAGPFSLEDIWFVYSIKEEGILKDHLFKIHVTTETMGAARLLLDTRNMCNNEKWAFEDYKNAKVEAARKLDEGDMMGYKMAKGSSKLLQMLGDKYNLHHKAPPGFLKK